MIPGSSGREHILLPVKGSFMALSIIVALLFNLLPWRDLRGVPDLLALVIAFWCIHQPRKTGIGIAWVLGLVMDAANGTLIGQHALAYAVVAFGAQWLHRRILWFPIWQQALHVLALLLVSQGLMLVARMAAGGTFPGWSFFSGSFIAAALWPVATYVLLAPQRRPEIVDENRPI
ncbi:MAG: rod shape-determining protein MreD [Betaproteobacteria bacterium]|jgi:rod shape-determining protein MreD|nr:rod shape-determining protein MreD [Betaproteobacteria bacterium]